MQTDMVRVASSATGLNQSSGYKWGSEDPDEGVVITKIKPPLGVVINDPRLSCLSKSPPIGGVTVRQAPAASGYQAKRAVKYIIAPDSSEVMGFTSRNALYSNFNQKFKPGIHTNVAWFGLVVWWYEDISPTSEEIQAGICGAMNGQYACFLFDATASTITPYKNAKEMANSVGIGLSEARKYVSSMKPFGRFLAWSDDRKIWPTIEEARIMWLDKGRIGR